MGCDHNGAAQQDVPRSPPVGDLQVFPTDNPWNQDISQSPVHPRSAAFVRSLGPHLGLHPDFGTLWKGQPNGIPYCVVTSAQEQSTVQFHYSSESDPGPYPIPDDAPIEGGPTGKGDRHVIIVDTENHKLYELFRVTRRDGAWSAGCGAIFDLTKNDYRPAGWTSADAAGLPIFPGLVRFEEVDRGEITHALRCTARETQRAYIHPARHWASKSADPDLPPMGLRLRLRGDYDISEFPPHCQVILRALKKYGMFVADNGGNWYLSGSPDGRWDTSALKELKRVKGRDFEAVYTGDVVRPQPSG